MKPFTPSHKKKAIVVGATSGMGRELARLLVADGYLVGITGRRKELLQALQEEQPNAYLPATTDIRDPLRTIEILECMAGQLGGVDLFVISAGAGEVNPDLLFQQQLETLQTNVCGFTCLADWAFTYFENQGHGHLAAISSIGGLRGSRAAPAYNASKAYQINYLEGLTQKAVRTGMPIHITDIRPGLVATDMAKGEGLFWVMPVEKATRQLYAAIKRRKKVAYITKRWRLIGLTFKMLPRFLHHKM